MKNRVSYIQRIHDFLNAPTEDTWKGEKELSVNSGNIRLSNIDFAYDNDKKVIDNLSIDIKAGERFALVGPSGCGKTTLAYMLVGFYKSQQGSIKIDEQNIKDCSLKAIRSNIGIVAQDVLVFNRDNLLLGNRNATEEEIIYACKNAGVYGFISNLEKGLDTVIGVEGLGLSGGQKQRIALARIYLKNPKIIIFDEATSALDKAQLVERLVFMTLLVNCQINMKRLLVKVV